MAVISSLADTRRYSAIRPDRAITNQVPGLESDEGLNLELFI